MYQKSFGSCSQLHCYNIVTFRSLVHWHYIVWLYTVWQLVLLKLRRFTIYKYDITFHIFPSIQSPNSVQATQLAVHGGVHHALILPQKLEGTRVGCHGKHCCLLSVWPFGLQLSRFLRTINILQILHDSASLDRCVSSRLRKMWAILGQALSLQENIEGHVLFIPFPSQQFARREPINSLNSKNDAKETIQRVNMILMARGARWGRISTNKPSKSK